MTLISTASRIKKWGLHLFEKWLYAKFE